MAHVEPVGKTSSLLKYHEGAGYSPSGGISSAPVKKMPACLVVKLHICHLQR